MQQYLQKVARALCILALPACITSTDDDVTIQPAIEDDSIYVSAYNKATSQYEVINNFETKYIIQTTLLSSAFREAFASRYQSLYNEPQPVLNEASQKTGFFVSIYTADDELKNLADNSLWNIQLIKSNKTLKPVKVEKLREKTRWRPFFKGISPWSEEYLVLFDTPAPNTGDQDLVYQNKAKLVFSNQDGRVTVSW